MKIKNLNFTHGLFLAPMAGVTDRAFRTLCVRYGAEGVFTEMISSRALCYNDKKTEKLAEIDPDEHPCFLQLFGNRPEIMAKAAVKTLEFSPDAIDINMGCPAPKIVSCGDGSALMKKPELVYDIVKEVSQALSEFSIPVTVKIRSGFDETSINAVQIAEICQKAGADAITVHGRTRVQMYSGKADREIIKSVKKSVSIPVIANGDITDAKSALDMFEKTGCDGIMTGMRSLGNPYIFEEIRCAMEGLPYTPPTLSQRLETAMEHARGMVREKGERVGMSEARRHMAWYVHGVRGAAAARGRLMQVSTLEELAGIFAELGQLNCSEQ